MYKCFRFNSYHNEGSFPCTDIRGGTVEFKIILYSNTNSETGHVHIIFQPPGKSDYADLRSYSLSSKLLTSSEFRSKENAVVPSIQLKEERNSFFRADSKPLATVISGSDHSLSVASQSPGIFNLTDLPIAENLLQALPSTINERPYKKISDFDRSISYSQSVGSIFI